LLAILNLINNLALIYAYQWAGLFTGWPKS